MTRRLQHVFFDITGTLLRVRGSVGAVYAPIAARYGHPFTAATIDAAFRPAIAAAPPPAFPGVPRASLPELERRWWHDVVQRTFASLGPFANFDSFFAEVFELFRTAAPWEPMPGALPMLASLRAAGRQLGIISDMDTRLYDVLAALELQQFFTVVALSGEIGYSKPDPRLFARALAMAGAPASRAVHVGDSWRHDVEGARSAGMLAIYFAPEPSGAATPAAASDVPCGRSLGEIPDLLVQLEQQTAAGTP